MKDYDRVLSTARSAFASRRTRPLTFRKQQLKNLLRLLEENEAEVLQALKMDLRKSSFEAKLGESENLKNEISVMLRNLDKFAADENLPFNGLAMLDSGCIRREPFGVVLVIGTWNYPFNMSLQPLVGALAAGNCVIVKPSELAPHSGETMQRLLPRYLDSECFQVVLGDVEDTKNLLLQKFDHIFYTGSANVGRSVATAAAAHLTPCTLELGGKSPCYVDADADFKLAAKRILWGKVMNLGMTCIAPDYLLCSKQAEETFIKVAHEVMQEWYGAELQKCDDLPRIINQRHFSRLHKLLESTRGHIAYGGRSDPDDLWIEPTIVAGVDGDDPLLDQNNEIFGPILPIVNIDSVDAAIEFINARQKPLALYVFAKDARKSKQFIEETSSGTVCVNDVIWQYLWPGLPFGGVGESGYGNYHGKYSFDTFSHKRAILHRGFSYVSEKLGSARYPPYSQEKLNFFIFIINYFDMFNISGSLIFAIFVALIYMVIILLYFTIY